MAELEMILREHAERYPKMQPSDAVKLIDTKTVAFAPSGETRLHLCRKAQINVRLGLALAGGAHPRRI